MATTSRRAPELDNSGARCDGARITSIRDKAFRTTTALLLTAAIASLWATAAQAEQRGYLSGFESGAVSGGELDVDGGFDALPGSPYQADSISLQGIATSPDGKRVYVADEANDRLLAFRAAANGSLTDAPGSPQELSSGALGVAPTPNGKFVFASDDSSGAIFAFKTSNGGITPTGQDPVEVTGTPRGLAVDPKGKRLYSANADDTISVFDIAANGNLSEVPSSPSGAVNNPYALAIAPDGKRLYIANRDSPSGVHAFDIGSDGSLTELLGSPWTTGGDNAFSLTISPDGGFVYAGNYASNSVAAFGVGPAGLTALAGSPYPSTEEPSALTLDASGSRLFVNGGQGPLQTWTVGGDGVPTDPLLNLFGEIGDFQSIALTPAQPPKAKLKAKVKKSSRKVKLNASKSTDDGDIVEYAWKFGDGEKTVTMGPKVTHRYAKDGKYRATVTLTDFDRCSTKRISVGQTPYCNGSKRAKASAKVKVK